MPARSITLFFDFISPYAYLAWTQIHALAERHGADVEPVPILFAALLDANGQKGPAEIPHKRAYMFRDVVRSAHHLGVPFAPPASHPFNPLLALRTSSADLAAQERRTLIDAIYRAAWGRQRDITNAAELQKVIDGAGLDGPRLIAWAGTTEAKDRVRQRTADAIARGVFGVPTMLVEGELFWGFDSFHAIERRLRGEDPVTAAAMEPWLALAPSAQRRGA